jgi:hypothetical protein
MSSPEWPTAARRCSTSAECAYADEAYPVSQAFVYQHSHGTLPDRMSLSILQSSVWAPTISLLLRSHFRPSASHVTHGFPRRMFGCSYLPFGTKEQSFAECRKKKKERNVTRSRPSRWIYFFCYGFVTSPTNIYPSFEERISVTDRRVTHWKHLRYYHSQTYIVDVSFLVSDVAQGRSSTILCKVCAVVPKSTASPHARL